MSISKDGFRKTWTSTDEAPANKKGKLKGYCKKCGMMIIDDGESSCPKCGGVSLTQNAPKESMRLYATGRTANTAGHPNKFDGV